MNSPFAWAAGWALVHSLWQGTIVGIALGVALLATRAPRIRYVAACVALIGVTLCFGVTLVRVIPEGLPVARIGGPSGQAPWYVPSEVFTASTADLSVIVPWLTTFWMAGVCLFYVRHVAGWIAVQRLRRRGVCGSDELWRQRLAALSARLQLAKPVQLLESCLVDAPIVLGYFRPVILMPVGLLTGMPVTQVEAILLHELAHVRRHDYLVNVLQRLVEGLLFYHPAVWWISHVIRLERENCCDDLAVAVSGDVHGYAAALAELEANRQSTRELALAATGGSLVKRIHRLLNPKRPAGISAPLLTVILMATAAVGLMAWQSDPLPAATSKDTPYVKWMNEDVFYIITGQERAAFQKLTTDAERNKFIEQFWLRRDPVPGTSTNAFKEEHYRRIAYSNERFASGNAGWNTDRGRMYIVYGPPDEIESHPTKTNGAYAHEVWLYHHVEGIGDRVFFTFVDRSSSGDYRLAPGNGR